MTQTLLTKGRSLSLALIVAALLLPLYAQPAAAQGLDNAGFVHVPVIDPNIDPLTGLPWYATYTPSNVASDAGIEDPEMYGMLDINEELARLGYL